MQSNLRIAVWPLLLALGALLVLGTQAQAGSLPAWDKVINKKSRFKVLKQFANEAVLDKETGLVWQRSPWVGKQDWDFAVIQCLDLTSANRHGFRLPKIEELTSLQTSAASGVPNLPSDHPFLNVKTGPSDYYWSGTTHPTITGAAFITSFTGAGGESGWGNTGVAQAYVWCVRGLGGYNVTE